jgi:hypothetical protein
MTKFRITILKSPKLTKRMTSQLKAFLTPGLLRKNMESIFNRARNTFEGISGLFADQKKIIKQNISPQSPHTMSALSQKFQYQVSTTSKSSGTSTKPHYTRTFANWFGSCCRSEQKQCSKRSWKYYLISLHYERENGKSG